MESNNQGKQNSQYFNTQGKPEADDDFANWREADFNSMLVGANIPNHQFPANLTNNNGGMSIPPHTAGDEANFNAKYFTNNANVSPPFNIRSPADPMFYPNNGLDENINNEDSISSQVGLQIPPRFQASIAAAVQQQMSHNSTTPSGTSGYNSQGIASAGSSNITPLGTMGNSNNTSATESSATTAPATASTAPPPGATKGAGKATKGKKKEASSRLRPCEFCRRRKTKCIPIPNTNNCQHCEARGTKCTFSENRPSEQQAKRGKYIVDELHPPPTVPIREVDPVQDYSNMPGYSLLKRTLSLQYPRSSFYIGPSSVYDPLLLNRIQLDKVDQVQLNQTTSLRKVAPNVQFTLKDDYTEQLYEMTERNVDAVERFVAPHGKVLIELYFRIVHPSFPVLHKKVFLEKYSRTHREFSAPLLAAVYSLAIQWWDYDPQLSQFPKPNVVSLQKLAMQTFSFVIERPKLSAVQAGLLLLQCRGENSRNWALCSQVVALAEELGLGLDCADWRLPKWERGLRRRLAWAVYLQDKWLSLIESRPSHIDESRNWSVKFVTDEDFPEKSNEPDSTKEGSSDIDIGKMLFKEMISLSQILSEILDSLFSMTAMKTITTIDDALKAAKPLQLKLRQWYHSLPPELHMNAVQPRKLSSNGYLQLAYFAAEISLHRKIITLLTPNCAPELIQVCRTAARTRLLAAIEFVRSLKPEHIHSFWHSSATANFTLIGTFAAILFVTAPTAEEANTYKDHVYNYRWILRVSAKGFDQAGSALEKLDTVLFHIPGLFNSFKTDSHALTPGDLRKELSTTPTPPAPQEQQRRDSETAFPDQPRPMDQESGSPKVSDSNQSSTTQQPQVAKALSRSNSNVSQTKQKSPYMASISPLSQMHSPYAQQTSQQPSQPSNGSMSTAENRASPVHDFNAPSKSPQSSKKDATSPEQSKDRSAKNESNEVSDSPAVTKQ